MFLTQFDTGVIAENDGVDIADVPADNADGTVVEGN